MKRYSVTTWILLLVAMCFVASALMRPPTALTQDTSTQTSQTGNPSVSTEVKSGEVVYVSGNDLVVRVADGEIKHVTVPDDFKFQVDGKDLTVHELTPGMKLTRTVTTTTTPKNVTTVRTITGTVWHVNAPSAVILKLPDDTTKQYKVPKGQMFDINGEKRDIFALKKGMKVSATVITETQAVVHTTAQTVTGQAPLPPPETPPEVGALLIEEESAPAAAPAVAKAKLPQTASMLPLVGLLGFLCVGASIAVKLTRS